jgi:hypothetical protein
MVDSGKNEGGSIFERKFSRRNFLGGAATFTAGAALTPVVNQLPSAETFNAIANALDPAEKKEAQKPETYQFFDDKVVAFDGENGWPS